MFQRILFCALCYLSCPFILFTQQLPGFFQSFENIGSINPAAIHLSYLKYQHDFEIGASYRLQWVGFSNGPQTQKIHGSYLYKDSAIKWIFGGHLQQDKVGPTGFTSFHAQVGGILSNDLYYNGLSFGLNFGANQYRIKSEELDFRETNDPFPMENLQKIYPDVGLGVFFYQLIDQKGILEDTYYYAGLSIPQTFRSVITFSDDEKGIELERRQHYYAQLGLIKSLGTDRFIEPSIWFRYVKYSPISINFNLRYQMTEAIGIGIGGSLDKNLLLEFGYILGAPWSGDRRFQIFYAFEYGFNTYGPSAGNTHQLRLNYSFSK